MGLARQPYQEPAERHDLGPMDALCPHCEALHWLDERLSSSSVRNPKFGMCCDNGKVRLPFLELPPPPLLDLFLSDRPDAKEFRENIWKYNRAFAFTSLCAQEDHTINNGRGEPVFRIFGELYHRGGPLQPAPSRPPTYAQLYIYDPETALDNRRSLNEGLNLRTLESLQTMLIQHHRYVRIYQHAFEVISQGGERGSEQITAHLRAAPGYHPRVGNLPTADEVAVIICDTSGEDPNPRDIVLHNRSQGLEIISDLHPSYVPLYYVLLFPRGEPGWHPDLEMREPDRETQRRLSQARYVAFRLQVRPDSIEFSTILRSKRLLQRYLVDMYASIDQNRLRFFRFNQPKLRAALYGGLQDALSSADEEIDLNDLGQKYVLPSSYVGGPRHMQQRYQDSMAIARHFGRCDIFLTMTCNSQWPEITRELRPGETQWDRPDLVTRVFQLKKKALLDRIYKHGIFGKAVAYIYTIEFQKRGLPHMHALIILADGWKINSVEEIDSCISAQWPDPVSQPLLFETVKRCMVHGPCGAANPQAPCMENGRCSKRFPKPFSDFTIIDEFGFPQYKRPNDGRIFYVGRHQVDNRWIVSYCPSLSAEFNCHINCESVASSGSLKYLFKYLQKGGDIASVEVGPDEIKQYTNGRYISASEAAHRIFQFDMHDQTPNVVRLQVHLPGQHMVVFNPEDDLSTINQRAANEQTTLTGWFAANANQGGLGMIARRYTYQEFPQHFVWKTQPKQWTVRKQGFAIGRMYFVGPTGGERFYLRHLLTVVKGAASFEELRSYQGTQYETFHAACLARGLLESDAEWRECLAEACEMQLGSRLRRLFATILIFCSPSQPNDLWLEFWPKICDDLPLRLLRMGVQNPDPSDIQDYGLYLLNEILHESGSDLADWPAMPRPTHNWETVRSNPLIIEQLSFNQRQERELLRSSVELLNPEQFAIFSAATASVASNLNKIFFVNGPGGTGKTFLYRVICNKIRGDGHIALCVASSGIAALLLPGGRTSHSMFKIPIDINEDTMCAISKNSDRGRLMQAAKAIIWDEISAQHRFAPEAVDRTLRDIRNDNRPFGGLTVIFGGDFQQTLPVIPQGSKNEIIGAVLANSMLWRNMEIHYLRQNMRIRHDPAAVEFNHWLLDIGHGRHLDDEGKVAIPSGLQAAAYSDLVDFVYPGISSNPPPPPAYFLDQMVLAPRNSDVAGANQYILDRMAGEERIFHSADCIVDENNKPTENRGGIPIEVLRSLDTSSFPPGELHLKVGCPIILLRNLSPVMGLCNGTRLIVIRISTRIIEAQILGGDHNGDIALIPRISLTSQGNSEELPFRIRRRQFPIKVALSLTINKSQGQSVKWVGLDLRAPVFAHGQLYVAISRATHKHHIRILAPEHNTNAAIANVVYPEVLIDMNVSY